MVRSRYVGLKTGVKAAVVTALRDGLTNDFWRSVDESLKDLTPNELVLPEFPVKMWRLPLVTVNISFGKVQWDNANRYTYGPPRRLKQVALTSSTVTLDIYSESPVNRDRLADTFLNMLIFAYGNPSNSAFTQRLHSFNENFGIDPILNTISVGSDSAGTGIPWAADRYVYTTSLGFDLNIRFTMDPFETLPGIKKISVDADGYGTGYAPDDLVSLVEGGDDA